MDLNALAVMFVFGSFHAEHLPAAARDALEAGHDSHSLRLLAYADGDDLDEIRMLFPKALAELGVPLPSPVEAAYATAQRIAGEIVAGTIGPYEGALQIDGKVYTYFPELKMLLAFASGASQYEDDEAHRPAIVSRIVEDSRKLIEGRLSWRVQG